MILKATKVWYARYLLQLIFSLPLEIMQINTIDSEWRLHFEAGDFVDALNPFENWSLAQIADVCGNSPTLPCLSMLC